LARRNPTLGSGLHLNPGPTLRGPRGWVGLRKKCPTRPNGHTNKSTRDRKVLSRIKKSKDYKNVLCVIQSDRASIIRELILHITKKRKKAKTIVALIIITSIRIIT